MSMAARLPRLAVVLLLALMLLLAGCGGKKQARVAVPPPPEITPEVPAPPEETAPTPPPSVSRHAYVEVGLASWYGPPYHNRRTSNGEIYDMHALTAAHRTLPLNSLVRITNLTTGHSVVVRITDRGPFIEGRMLDLSVAAAKQVDVWRPGLARVRLEVLETPAAIDHGGRWCVQMGAFSSKQEAAQLKEKLVRRYRTANVLQFTGPTGEWIRVRVEGDDKARAESLLKEVKVPEGAVFLVRLD